MVLRFRWRVAGILGRTDMLKDLIRTLKEEEVHLNDYDDITTSEKPH